MRLRVFPLAILLAAVAGLWLGCGSEDTANPSPDLDGMIADGWAAYESGNFTTALGLFQSVIDLAPTHLAARTGAGWSSVRLILPADALAHFERALADHPPTDADSKDALSGVILAAALTDSFAVAAHYGEIFVETHGDNYAFAHEATTTSRDIRILYALAAFHTADYVRAEAEVEHLDPTVNLDPASPTYRDELLAAIEALLG